MIPENRLAKARDQGKSKGLPPSGDVSAQPASRAGGESPRLVRGRFVSLDMELTGRTAVRRKPSQLRRLLVRLPHAMYVFHVVPARIIGVTRLISIGIYDPNSDHRRKGVYRKDVDNLRIRNATLQTLIHGILHYSEDEVFELVHQIRSCNNLDDVAEAITARERGLTVAKVQDQPQPQEESDEADQFGSELSGKMSELMLDGSVKFVGGTSNLIFLPHESEEPDDNEPTSSQGNKEVFSVAQWTRVTDDEELVRHLITMYFTWHYAYFTVLNKSLFYRDFIRGHSSQYCSSLLVNAMLALGCHFSSWKGARENPDDSATAGDHFFKEAKRLMLENDEHEKAKLCTVQALAIMSVREAGCGREGKGWVYSGMSFRMAYDLGLNVDASSVGGSKLTDEEIDARRITFWGCFLFDKWVVPLRS